MGTNNKTENKLDSVKNYFKNPQKHASNSNIIENSFNTITIENSNLINPNFGNNNFGQDLFKVYQKSTSTIINNQALNVEKEQKDKENNETNEKIKVSEKITITNMDIPGILLLLK